MVEVSTVLNRNWVSRKSRSRSITPFLRTVIKRIRFTFFCLFQLLRPSERVRRERKKWLLGSVRLLFLAFGRVITGSRRGLMFSGRIRFFGRLIFQFADVGKRAWGQECKRVNCSREDMVILNYYSRGPSYVPVSLSESKTSQLRISDI